MRAILQPRFAFNFTVIAIYLLSLRPRVGYAASDVNKLKSSVVKITVAHSEGVDAGSGVILCQSRDRAYIATAKHVLVGEGAVDDDNRPTARFKGIQSLEVKFFGGDPTIKSSMEDFQIRRAESRDLALLVVKQSVAGIDNISIGGVEGLAEGQDVISFGQSTASDSDFLAVFGKISAVREFILISPAVEKGFSGGPLFVSSGSLVGINIQKAGSLTKAVPIDEFFRTFREDLPSGCLESSKKSTEPTQKQRFSKAYSLNGPFLVGRDESKNALSFFVTPAVLEASMAGKNLLVSTIKFTGYVVEESTDAFGFDTEVIISNRPIYLEGRNFSGVEWGILNEVDSRMLPSKILHVVPRTNMGDRKVGSGIPLQWIFNIIDDTGSFGLEQRLSKNDPFIAIEKGFYIQLLCWTYWGGSHYLVFYKIDLTIEYQEY